MSNSRWINVFMLVCLGILLYILFADKCKRVVEKPQVIKGKDVVKLIDITDKRNKEITDSFNLILNKAYRDNDKNYTAYIKALNENAVLLNQRNLLENQTFPDTCTPIVNLWKGYANQLENNGVKKDAAAKLTITGLQGTVWEQQQFLKAKDSIYGKLHAICDTCAKALIQNEKYIAKIKPKNEIIVGVSAITRYDEIKPSVGLILGFRGKTGTQVTAGYYLNKNVTVTISRPLIKF